MRIKRLRVGSFGKLKDFHAEFSEGLNVIYGENETGKTTLQAFIKAMLYGMYSRKQGIKENHRKRFLPWSNERASGELHIIDDRDDIYIIKREFGGSKISDYSRVINATSGNDAVHLDKERPGLGLIGVGEEAFERTLFVRQLGSHVDRDKEDEIIKKLSNMHQSGDENVSYHNARAVLTNARKEITNTRSVINFARLDKLQRLLEEGLKEEKRELEKLHEDNIEDALEIKRRKEQRHKLEKTVKELEGDKILCKKYLMYKDYKQLSGYIKDMDTCRNQIKSIDEALSYGDYTIDEDYVNQLGKEYNDYRQKETVLDELYAEKKGITESLRHKNGELSLYPNFDQLEQGIEYEIIDCSSSIDKVRDKKNEISEIKNRLRDLNEGLNKEREKLGHLSCFEKVGGGLETQLYKKEERIRELKQKLTANSKLDNLALKKEIIQDKLKGSKIQVVLGFVMLVGAIICGIIIDPLVFFLSAAGIAVIFYSNSQKNRFHKEIQKIDHEIRDISNIGEIQNEIDSITQELHSIYGQYGAADYNEFISLKKEYDSRQGSIELLKARIYDRENELNRIDEKKLEDELINKEEYISALLNKCKCDSIDSFKLKLKEYNALKAEKVSFEKEIKVIDEKIQKQINLLDTNKNSLYDKLALIGKDTLDMGEIEDLIQFIYDNLKEKRNKEAELNTLEKQHETKLDNRNIEDIQKELQGFNKEDVDNRELDEDILDKAIRQYQEELDNVKEVINSIKHRMDKRFYKKRTMAQIDEDIKEAEVEIEVLRKTLDAIDTALRVLEESFNEIQRSYGPKLNKCVGEIIETITGGKYSDVKVSEELNIRIREPEGKGIVDLDYLSNGTWDQVYFCLRLALINVLFEEKRSVPLLLDDSFVQYDDSRLKWALEYLYEYSKNKQVILFTCHKREIGLLQGQKKVNIINL